MLQEIVKNGIVVGVEDVKENEMQSIESVENQFKQIAPQLGADEREIEMFLSADDEEAEAAIMIIAGRVGARLQNFEKARHCSRMLTGLRAELVNLRRIAGEMISVAKKIAV